MSNNDEDNVGDLTMMTTLRVIDFFKVLDKFLICSNGCNFSTFE